MKIYQAFIYNQWNNKGIMYRDGERIKICDLDTEFDLIRFSFLKKICVISRTQRINIILLGFWFNLEIQGGEE